MLHSSEVLFFSTDIGCLGECFKLLFSPFLAGVLSPITNCTTYKKMGGVFPAGPYRASSFTKVYLYSVYRQLIVDGPRAIPILFEASTYESSHVLGIS